MTETHYEIMFFSGEEIKKITDYFPTNLIHTYIDFKKTYFAPLAS